MIKQLLKKEWNYLLASILGEKKSKWVYISFILINLVLVFSSLTQNVASYQLFLKINAPDFYLLITYFSTFCFLFVYGALFTTTALFQWKDYDLLTSLPIPFQTLLYSKLIFLYFINLYITALMYLPSIVIYILGQKTSLKIEMMLVLSLWIIPLLPLVFSNILGLFIIYGSKYVKNKEIFQSISGILFTGVIIYLSAQTLTTDEIFNLVQSLTRNIHQFLPWSIFFSGIVEGNVSSFVAFTGISLGSFWIFLRFTSKHLQTIHFILENQGISSRKKEIQVKSTSPLKTLIKKEFQTLWSIPVYTINTLFGLIAVVGAVSYLWIHPTLRYQMKVSTDIFYTLPLIFASLLSSTPTTASSLSLEGKSVWMLESLPFSTREVLLSKVLFQLILVMPISIFSSIILTSVFQLDLVWTIIFLSFPLMGALFFTFVGLLFQLKFPNFYWDNPSVVVKQGIPVICTLFFAFLFYGGFWWVIQYLGNEQEVARVYLLGILLLSLLLSVCFEYVLKLSVLFPEKKRKGDTND